MEIEQDIGKCIFTAKKAGCPQDQVEQFLNCAYCPWPWQWKFHAAAREADYDGGPVDVGLGGARGPGKSHAVLSQAALDDCQRVEGLKVLFLRQTGTSAKESFDDLVRKTLFGHIIYWKTANSLRFENGSRIILGGFKDERDIDKYIGIEYDLIIVEELTQLTEEKYDKLRGSLRTSKPNWRPRMYTSFNPGGRGHTFVKNRYILPYREEKEVQTRFIPSTYKDNPALNVEYIEYLEGLQGDLGRAWREGDWDLFEGQYFDEWRREKHVCRPFEDGIPDTWLKFRSIDISGRSGITSCHWYALDRDGRVWVYREHYATGMDMDEHAERITQMSVDKDGNEEKYQYTVIDSSAAAKAGYSETAVEIYQRHGVGVQEPFIYSDKHRVIGWNAVHTYLRLEKPTPANSNPQPKLKVWDTCVNMIRTIPMLQHDELHAEDVDCFVKDTMILTPNGEIAVQNLKVGDKVVTPIGKRKVIKAGISGTSDRVKTVYLSNGRRLTGTANHPVYVMGKGLVKIENLTKGDILAEQNRIYLAIWKLKKLYTTVSNIGEVMGEVITGRAELISNWVIKNFIVKFILTTLEKFLKDLIFTIKTTIATIILPTISLQCQGMNTQNTTDISVNQKLLARDSSGKTLKKERNSYEQTLMQCTRTLQYEDLSAEIVEMLLKLNGLTKFIAKTVGILKDCTKPFVPYAIKDFCKKVMENGRHKPVHISVVGNYGSEKVYRLTIEEAHLYYANGILSHNTKGEDHAADDLRYMLQSLREGRAPKQFNAVEKRIHQLHHEEQSYNFNYQR